MRQVFFDSNGQVHVLERPTPRLRPGTVLVHNTASLISTGTELTGILAQREATNGGASDAAGNEPTGVSRLMVRAKVGVQRLREDPELLSRAINYLRVRGPIATLNRVRFGSGWDTPATNGEDVPEGDDGNALPPGMYNLGYSCAGQIIDVGAGVTDLKPGDWVACSGASKANHAELVVIPRNLVARIPEGVEPPLACFSTVGAIALQGVRRTDPTLGETVVVVGLGLIGQLTVQLLRAAGCHVIGIDIIPSRLALARAFGASLTLAGNDASLVEAILDQTDRYGADAAILTAGTDSSTILNQAFEYVRERGRVVIVGAIGMDMERATMYRKELDVRISRSTGPGRYDVRYEDGGQDYPLGFVRWTENRNMETVLRLLADGSLNLKPMLSAVFDIAQAPSAYEHLIAQRDKTLAVVLSYPEPSPIAMPSLSASGTASKRVRIGVIGTGAFAQSIHLPNLQRIQAAEIAAICSARKGGTAATLAKQYEIPQVAETPEAALNAQIDVVLIATRHDSHANLTLKALQAGKHVFVEKPLALCVEDAAAIVKAANEAGKLVWTGFNRRFSPYATALRLLVNQAKGPRVVTYRVNAGALPGTHWLLDPIQGGGRLLGEGVHFFDFITWLVGAEPQCVQAVQLQEESISPQNAAITITYSDGSVGTLIYTSVGDTKTGKERIEVFADGVSAILDDFVTVEGTDLPRGLVNVGADKGHFAQMSAFINTIATGVSDSHAIVTVADGYWATACAVTALQALKSGTCHPVPPITPPMSY